MSEYQILETTSFDGFKIIEITSGKFKGLQYFYRGVRFEEKKDECIMHIDYEIVSEHQLSPLQKIDLNVELGEILYNMLDQSLEEGTVVYHGGR